MKLRKEPFTNCIAVTLEFEDLPNHPWHDTSEVSFDERLRAAHPSLRKEAEASINGKVFALHYGAVFSDPDEPQRNMPWGWRQFNLMEWFERKHDRCALSLVTDSLVAAAAAEYAIRYAGYLILEPGPVIPLHFDAANWCLSYHFGVVVPENCFQVVSGETRFHEDGGSMLTAAEIGAIRALSAELPSGTLAYSK